MVVRNEDGSGHLLHIKQGVTQGDPLCMIAYGIKILLIIREICTTHPHVVQPWYADETGAGETFEALHEHMRNLLARGPPRGYFPDPTKSILVISPRNV